MESVDRSRHYEVVKPLGNVGSTAIFEARSRATGMRVILYRVALPNPGMDTESVIIDLQQEALLVNPRVPLLIDAWRTPVEVAYVRLEYAGHPLESVESRTALSATGRNVFEEAAFQTLAALAALHDLSITHKYLTADSYIVTPSGLVMLRDTGIWRRVNDRVEAVGNEFQFSLASKSARLDVAEWATAVAGFAAGKPFNMIDDDGLPTATPEEIERMEEALRRGAPSKELADMIVNALEAFNNIEIGGYENAARALEKFPRRLVA